MLDENDRWKKLDIESVNGETPVFCRKYWASDGTRFGGSTRGNIGGANYVGFRELFVSVRYIDLPRTRSTPLIGLLRGAIRIDARYAHAVPPVLFSCL